MESSLRETFLALMENLLHDMFKESRFYELDQLYKI